MWQQLSRLHPGQFDFHHNISLSLAPIWSLGSLFWPTHLNSPPTHLISPSTHSTSLHFTHSTPHHLRHRVGKASMYKAKRIFHFGICRLSTYQGIRLDHSWASPSSKEWPVGWMQPDLLACVVISLVISIGQGVLTRWQKSDTSEARLDGIGLWGWPEIIGPDVCIRLEQFWND